MNAPLADSFDLDPCLAPALEALAGPMLRIACEAAALIRAMDPACCAEREKADSSPVSLADEAAEAHILRALAVLAPGAAFLAEEACAAGAKPLIGRTFFVVDALDGTRGFLAGSPEYTVNIALVARGRPVIGAIVAPALDEAYLGVVGVGAWRGSAKAGTSGDAAALTPIHTRKAPPLGLLAFASRSGPDPATQAVMDAAGVSAQLELYSSLKFARVAAGQADVYPRLQELMQWDVAAGHALVEAAGGRMTQPDGAPMVYGADAPCERAQTFIAWGDPRAADRFTADTTR